MKKRSIIVLTLLAGCFTNSFAQKGEKTLTVEVSNEWTQNKTDEPIVIDLNNLKAGFNIKSATVWEGNKEIPSQLDDLNGDARADELAFLIDMPAKSNKSFRIILSSEKSEKNYPARTYAQMKAYGHNNKFANITGFSAAGTENVYSFVYHHGPAIESELVAYRIYFNEKQTVDPYSKVNKRLEIKETCFYPTSSKPHGTCTSLRSCTCHRRSRSHRLGISRKRFEHDQSIYHLWRSSGHEGRCPV